MTQEGANLTFNIEITYNWTGMGGDSLWSNPANWSGNAVPKADSEVTVSLNADDAKTIVIDTAEATANLFYISGPQTGSAMLEIVAAENVEGAKLTVADKMLTTGNVTVTQRANVAVNGTSQMGDGKPIPTNQVVQASFQVNGANAKYTIESGVLAVQGSGSQAGDVSVSNEATLEVGEAGSLSAAQAITSYFGNATSAASGTLSIAGTANFSTQMGLSSQNFTVELAGVGLLTTPLVDTYNGLRVSSSEGALLQAPENGKMTVSGRNGSALAGAGDLSLQGAVNLSSTITADYTGELTAVANSTVTLGTNRPKLSVAEGVTVNITPTAEEQASGVVSFATSMTAVPSATFTVEGVDAVTPEVDNGELTLSWTASTATLSTTGNWSASNWTVGETTGRTAPTSGVVVLDGTAEGGITVTLDTAIPADITTINVRGDVTLAATAQQVTLPTCINVEDGATLGVGANFAKADGSAWPATWAIPENTTLRITGDGFDFGGITVDHNQYIQVYADLEVTATGAEGTPALIDPENNLWCRGKVTVSCDYVTLRKLYWLDDDVDGLTVTGDNVTIEGLHQVDGSEGLTLSGNNVTITGYTQGFAFADGATITSSGTGNVLDGVTDWPNTFTVTSGDLTIDSCTSLKGALLSNGATLKLASDWATRQTLHIAAANNDTTNTVLDMSAVAATNRPTIARWGSSVYRLPKTIVVKPSEAEESANVITLALEAPTDGNPGPALQEDAVADVRSSVQTWVPVIEKSAAAVLTITNVPAPNGVAGLEEAVALAIRRAAAEAGVKGAYTVQLTTKGQSVEVTAEALNDVLGCFIGLKATANAERTTLTYAYDFGIVGVKRNADGNGWTVTAKVQGAAGAKAGFAEGNVYTLTVNGEETTVTGATVGEGGTVTLPLPGDEVTGDAVTLGVKVSRPAQTPAQ